MFSHTDRAKPTIGLFEYRIDFLETSVCGFRVEEICDWQNCEVDNSKNDVGFVADGVESNGGDHHNHEIEYPVGGCGETIGWGTNFEGYDFSGIEPCEIAELVVVSMGKYKIWVPNRGTGLDIEK